MKTLSDNIFHLFRKEKNILLLALLIAVSSYLALLFCELFYRDSVFYVAMANSIYHGNWQNGLQTPITPFLSLLSAPFMFLGFNAQLAVMTVSSIFVILTIPPLYKLLSYFTDTKKAAWGTVLFISYPPIIRYGMAPLLDGGRWFFLVLSIYFIYRFVDNRKMKDLIFLGMSFAGLALIRGEGIVYVGILTLIFGAKLLHTASWKFKRSSILITIIPLLVMLVCVSPRLVSMNKLTGVPALDTRQSSVILGVLKKFSLLEDKTTTASKHQVSFRLKRKFDQSYFSDKSFNKRFWANALGGCNIILLPFSLMGIFLLQKKRRWTFDHSIIIAFIVVNAFMFFLIKYKSGRYFYINTILLLPFTLLGLNYCITFLLNKNIPMLKHLILIIASLMITIQFVRGTKRAFKPKREYYQSLKEKIDSLRTNKEWRSGTKHPVILSIGVNYGWGFHMDCNQIEYNKYNSIDTNYKIKTIIAEGIPSRLALYTQENLNKIPILKPDYIIVSKDNDLEGHIDFANQKYKIKELKIPGTKKETVCYVVEESI